MHITTVGFDKAKARMNSPANSQKKTKSLFGRAGPHRHALMAQSAMYSVICTKNNSAIQTNGTTLIRLKERKKSDKDNSFFMFQEINTK